MQAANHRDHQLEATQAIGKANDLDVHQSGLLGRCHDMTLLDMFLPFRPEHPDGAVALQEGLQLSQLIQLLDRLDLEKDVVGIGLRLLFGNVIGSVAEKLPEMFIHDVDGRYTLVVFDAELVN